jgi:hypothetical protein
MADYYFSTNADWTTGSVTSPTYYTIISSSITSTTSAADYPGQVVWACTNEAWTPETLKAAHEDGGRPDHSRAMERLLPNRKERERAKRVARELLMKWLTPEQRAELNSERYFTVRRDDGKEYRVLQGQFGNVQLIRDGKVAEVFCCHPSEPVPDEDAMLAQAMMLRFNEREFLARANATVLH